MLQRTKFFVLARILQSWNCPKFESWWWCLYVVKWHVLNDQAYDEVLSIKD
jgi:hypothetical protein